MKNLRYTTKSSDSFIKTKGLYNQGKSTTESIENIPYYNSYDLSRLIFGSILMSLPSMLMPIPFGLVGLIAPVTLLAINWDYIQGFWAEREIVREIAHRTMNGDQKLKTLIQVLNDDLGMHAEVKNSVMTLQSMRAEFNKQQERLNEFYTSVNSRWYLSRNPDEIVPADKTNELETIKCTMFHLKDALDEEVAKHVSMIARNVLSSAKYTAIIDDKTTTRKATKNAYLRRMVKQIEDYVKKEVDPFSIQEPKIKMVPKSQSRRFFLSDIGG